jgi:FAD/FMN-containing dehydrogenase
VSKVSTVALIDSLRAEVRCPVFSATDEVAQYAHDFGGLSQQIPLAVVQADCAEDVMHTLRVAQALKVPVSVRGAGHSCRGQSLCPGGIVLVNSAAEAQFTQLEGDRIEVTGRTRWADLLTALRRVGQSVPVLTNALSTTVGGTLSAGGYGTRSFIAGAQIDHVERLQLIQPDGTMVWCSPTENPALFHFSLAGYGQLGVIEKVMLRTVPYQPFICVQLHRHEGVSALVAALAWTQKLQAEVPDHFVGRVEQGAAWSVFGAGTPTHTDTVLNAFPMPLQHMPNGQVQVVSEAGWLGNRQDEVWALDPRCRNIWCDYCLSFDGLRAFAAFVETGPRRELLCRNLLRIYVLSIRRLPHNQRWPFAAHSIQAAPQVYGLGLHYRVAQEDRAGLAAALAAQRACLEQCLALGGRPYLYGWHDLDATAMRQVYGSDYDQLRLLRRTLDPHNLFNAQSLLSTTISHSRNIE